MHKAEFKYHLYIVNNLKCTIHASFDIRVVDFYQKNQFCPLVRVVHLGILNYFCRLTDDILVFMKYESCL